MKSKVKSTQRFSYADDFVTSIEMTNEMTKLRPSPKFAPEGEYGRDSATTVHAKHLA
jgi:hypothetical protein